MRKKTLNRKIESTVRKWVEPFDCAFCLKPLYETGYYLLITLNIRAGSFGPRIEPTIINPRNYQFRKPFKVFYKLFKKMFSLSLRRLPKFLQ